MANISGNLVRAGLFLTLVAITLVQFRIGLYEQSEFNSSGQAAMSRYYELNPRLLTYAAGKRHLVDADFAEADRLYQRALTVNSVYLPAWLGLAELRIDQGRKEAANAILEQVDIYTRDVQRWRWDKALVAYQLGRKDILAKDLGYIIRNMPGKTRNDAMRTAFAVWPDPLQMPAQVGPDNALHLFRYATWKKKVGAATALWPTVRDLGIAEHKKEILSFLNMLMGKGEVEIAAEIWKTHFNPDSLLYNGNFEKEPMQRAFGWRLGKAPGSSFRLTQDSSISTGRALHFHFSRQENLNFHHFFQIVPLEGGRQYQFTGSARSRNLTTDRLPFLEVYGYKCKAPHVKYKEIRNDQPWQEFSFLFDVPDDCDAMVVRLRRIQSHRIDNKLAGDLWLKDLAVTVTGDRYTSPEGY